MQRKRYIFPIMGAANAKIITPVVSAQSARQIAGFAEADCQEPKGGDDEVVRIKTSLGELASSSTVAARYI
jgi:hypothetical protein